MASALFCMVMVVFRYHSLRSILVSRSELIRSNEFMTIQNEIIREKSEELIRSNTRLREFAHMVSHDLKTPLRGISNLAGWIREDCADTLSRDGISHLEMIDRQIADLDFFGQPVRSGGRARKCIAGEPEG